jgi:hypothetical protein
MDPKKKESTINTDLKKNNHELEKKNQKNKNKSKYNDNKKNKVNSDFTSWHKSDARKELDDMHFL